MTLTKLYKKSSLGKIEEWSIQVIAEDGMHPRILTSFGEMGGKIQLTEDVIREGKNLGKKNETTPLQQAIAEATSKWEKKLKSGYVQTLEDAVDSKVDEHFVTGGILPMLAHSFEDHGHKILFPCAGQAKLDGIKCIAIKKGESVTLWSRTRKPILSCPHIVEAIAKEFKGIDIILDGELYADKLKADFEKIVSAVRKEHPSEGSLAIEYHIYDLVQSGSFRTRSSNIYYKLMGCEGLGPLRIVSTFEIEDIDHANFVFKSMLALGYEGLMLRNWDGEYEHKRSYNLQKWKLFEDAEFEIVGVEEGRGKLAGLVGAFVCVTKEGVEFRAKPSGNQEETKKYIDGRESAIGKYLTVQFQGITSGGVPRFPVGLRIREVGL